jgi:hypothetical protein
MSLVVGSHQVKGHKIETDAPMLQVTEEGTRTIFRPYAQTKKGLYRVCIGSVRCTGIYSNGQILVGVEPLRRGNGLEYAVRFHVWGATKQDACTLSGLIYELVGEDLMNLVVGGEKTVAFIPHN